MKRPFLNAYKGAKAMLSVRPEELTMGEKMAFLLVMALFEVNNQVTMYDVKKANNGVKENTTNSLIISLVNKGYLTKQRSNQFFSKSYLTVTDKGLLLARSFRSCFASLGSLR
jgi:DNA-binding MarR family transcriptional regulator